MAKTIDQLTKAVNAKLQTLKLTQGQAIGDKVVLSMERIQNALKKKVEEVHDLKTEIQELMFEAEKEEDEIVQQGKEIEERVSMIEKTIDQLGAVIKECKQVETQTEEKKEQDINAKLPKLVITKFKGTPADWLRFWGQFAAEVDATNVSQITKFSYLKELLEPQVRSSIDGLPFTTEGYERAKNILKTKFGKESEIVNAYVSSIMSLPVIHGANPNKVSQFYEKLCSSVQALETMGKLGEVNGYVRMTLNKLEGIRGDLVRTDDDWQEWKFDQLVEALRKWTVRNPAKPDEDPDHEKPPSWKQPFKPPPKFPKSRDRMFNSRQEEWKTRPCVYCESREHKSVDCGKVVGVALRKKYLSEKRLCFNCTGTRHRAAECRIVRSCQKCNGRHHTSICDRDSQQMLLATGEGAVIYPVVVVVVDGIKCRALLDTGAGSSYASAALIKRLGKQPSRMEHKRIDMMMCSTNQKIYQYDVKISSVVGDFNMAASVSKKEVLC